MRGLTTAASLWGTAAIGILAGAGELLIAVATAGLVLVVLICRFCATFIIPIPTPMRTRLPVREEASLPETHSSGSMGPFWGTACTAIS